MNEELLNVLHSHSLALELRKGTLTTMDKFLADINSKEKERGQWKRRDWLILKEEQMTGETRRKISLV